MSIWSKIANYGGLAMKATGKASLNAGKNVLHQAGRAVLHPAHTLQKTGSALKTAVVGGAAAYVGWEKLTTDKSVARIVGDTIIGEKTIENIEDTVNDVKEIKVNAGKAIDSVNHAMTDVNNDWSGMTKFFRGLFNGNGIDMFSNFFKNMGAGNVSGLSVAGLVASAFLVFGRFGWLGKLAGLMMAFMLVGNNANLKLQNAPRQEHKEPLDKDEHNEIKGIKR